MVVGGRPPRVPPRQVRGQQAAPAAAGRARDVQEIAGALIHHARKLFAFFGQETGDSSPAPEDGTLTSRHAMDRTSLGRRRRRPPARHLDARHGGRSRAASAASTTDKCRFLRARPRGARAGKLAGWVDII